MKQKIIIGILLLSLSFTACKKQLDISNDNLPTPSSAFNESGIVLLAQGTIYRNGFF